MKTLHVAALALALLGGAGGATTLEFGVAYHGAGGEALPPTLMERGWARLGVADVALAGGQFSAGVSTRGADAAYARGLALPPLGALTTRSELGVTWAGGVRLASRVTASAGPVALNVGGSYFTAAATALDPLAAWTLAPTDLRDRGWQADATARYRLSRALIVVAGGEFGPQNHGLLGLEGRRDLTRTLPLPEGAEEGAEPETESLGTLSWRVGARAGAGVLGATAGLTYATEDGLSLALDALAGPRSLGLSGSVNAPGSLGEGSTLRLYAAYEPWRVATAPLRAGLEVGLPLGPGEASLIVSGGQDRSGRSGFGARLGYRLDLTALNTAPEEGAP